jgi:hypothetical protein
VPASRVYGSEDARREGLSLEAVAGVFTSARGGPMRRDESPCVCNRDTSS